MNENQLPLIPSYAPKARVTDPGTSHKAAEAVKVKSGSQRQLLLLAFYDRRYEHGLTDEQAASRAAGVSLVSEYATRCSELRNAGLIAPTGEERVGSAGVERIVSEITFTGIQLVREEGWR